MTRTKKSVILAALGLLEIIFLSWAIAANRPRRASEVAAFMSYQSAPTSENRDLWLKERRVSEREVMLRRYLGCFLAVGNLGLVVYLARRHWHLVAVVSLLMIWVPPAFTQDEKGCKGVGYTRRTHVLGTKGRKGPAGPLASAFIHEMVHICYNNDLDSKPISSLDQEKEAFSPECELLGFGCACARDPTKCGY